MKGLLLSSYYTSKKSLFTYLIVALASAIMFSFFNPIMTCFLAMIFLISPVTDNIKHEKDSRWMYYVSTLPTGRATYVKSYFVYYGILILIGLIMGAGACFIVTQNINLTLISILVGIGGSGTYAIMFPLTFKFGPENSNVIMISTSFIVIGLFFFVFFGFVMPSLSDNGSFDSVLSNLTTLWVLIIYGIIGCALLILSYIASLQIFKRQEL
ncbi:ABC-2 transporter permease [Staphylococcus lugdunensis]|uniref:ABC-2 transporter permease n=1 Tax=Staphylococcus lugdunensis TaxID=28035 RepID=UPI0009B7042E|nr:ABC-2 transporter permease [Staphylococcus lugdunensis]ARB78994.1 ABC-2 transporter permease [Staphylococcus lugdunensis]PNZ63337.1 ABC-2 transporter permease [Staphylococcus lugdunensis]SQI88961.1 membrane protein [Staphylococcus lugdunensis]